MTQLNKVLEVMADHKPHSLDEIASIVVASESSVSARLRDLRKEKFGGLNIERSRQDGKVFYTWKV